MAEHPNAQLWRKGKKAFSRGDADAARDILSEDVVYHFPGRAIPSPGITKDWEPSRSF